MEDVEKPMLEKEDEVNKTKTVTEDEEKKEEQEENVSVSFVKLEWLKTVYYCYS